MSRTRVSLVKMVTGQSIEDRINERLAELETQHPGLAVIDIRLQLTDSDRTSASFGGFPDSSLALIVFQIQN